MAPPPRKIKRKKMALSTQYRLIGQFVFMWNLLEGSLNRAITTLCNLDALHGAIVTANLNFQTKMHIITTMTDLLSQYGKSKGWSEDAADTFAQIYKINNEWRNLVVHNIITPVDTKSVKFIKVQAKKKLQWPNIVRTKLEFDVVANEIFSLCKAVDKLAADLSLVPVSALAKALATSPIVPTFGLGLAGSPLPLSQGLLHSDLGPVTLGTWPEMPADLLSIAPEKDKKK